MYQVNCYLKSGDKEVYPKTFGNVSEALSFTKNLMEEDNGYTIQQCEIVKIGVDKTSKI